MIEDKPSEENLSSASAPTPLADGALARLRSYAQGNGVDPESLALIEKKESLYEVLAEISFSPRSDLQLRSYAGSAQSKGAKMMPNLKALQDEVERLRASFAADAGWIQEALREIRAAPFYGWGMDGAKIPLPASSHRLIVTEPCPACAGKGLLPCPDCQNEGKILCFHCHGALQEPCPTCRGTGEDPTNPKQPCLLCKGLRITPCRFCEGTGKLNCAACSGRGGTPCPTCAETAQVTQEAHLEASAEMRFALARSQHLPSGLLRSMERMGQSKVAKEAEKIDFVETDKGEEKQTPHRFTLKAIVPYADIKLRIGKKAGLVAVFGKNGRLSGLPPFLDEGLKPWRLHLHQAALGKQALEKATEARAIADGLKLLLSGKKTPNDLRRLYPAGLSAQVAYEIMDNLGDALQRATLKARLVTSILCFAGGSAVLAGVFLTPLLKNLVSFAPLNVLRFGVPVILLGLAWLVLKKATRLALENKFPGLVIKGGNNIGKTGYLTLLALSAFSAVLLFLTA